jgi:hypothetical protein
VWVCTSHGDVSVGEQTALISLGGLCRADSLLKLKDADSVGRMQGSWPRLESYFPLTSYAKAMAGRSQDADKALRRDIQGLCLVHTKAGPAYRVGSWPQERLEEFSSNVIGRAAVMERGPAGWTWLLPQGEEGVGRSNQGSAIDESEALLALWQPSNDSDEHQLQVTERAIRSLTLASLCWAKRSFSTRYRPRYSPLFVELTSPAPPKSHATVEAVVSTSVADFIGIWLGRPGAFLIANGLLLADAGS